MPGRPATGLIGKPGRAHHALVGEGRALPLSIPVRHPGYLAPGHGIRGRRRAQRDGYRDRGPGLTLAHF